MRGGLLLRDAAIDAERASVLAGASVSVLDHNARAAAPDSRDHDGVVGSRGHVRRWSDR